MSDKNDLTDLVRARIRGTPLDDDAVAYSLNAEIERFATPTDQHAVWWNGQAWTDTDAWNSQTRQRVQALADSLTDHSRSDGWRLISRADVFRRRG